VPAWFGAACQTSNFVTASVPVLGQMYVHRRIAAAFTNVLQSIADAGKGALVDRADYGGTYACRTVRGSAAKSPHSWGIAADLNVSHLDDGNGAEYVSKTQTNFKCPSVAVPNSLRALAPYFQAWGFTWGGTWNSYLDPMHFEATEITVKLLEGGKLTEAEQKVITAARAQIGAGPIPVPGAADPKVVLLPGSTVIPCHARLEGDTTRCDLRSLAEALGYEVIDHLDEQGKLYLSPRPH
jgi:hypothetical protein